MLLCMQTAGEALRVWGVGKGLPSHCQEAAYSAVPCPCERPSQPPLLFAEGLARPFPEHEIQPPATAAGSRNPAVHPSTQRCPHTALPVQAGSALTPQSPQRWDMAMAAVAKCTPWAAACFGQCVLSLVPHRLHLSRSISNLLHRFYIGTRVEVSVCVWWLTYSPQGEELSLERGSCHQCPGQNPTASTWEARAAPRVTSRIPRPLAHPAPPAYDMLQFDGFEPCAWNGKKHTVTKGRRAPSSVLQGGTVLKSPGLCAQQ